MFRVGAEVLQRITCVGDGTLAPTALRQFRDVVALVAEKREALLHAQLLHSVHLVRFAPPVIELRPEPDAPRDLSSRLAALLSEATGTRWNGFGFFGLLGKEAA